MYISIFFMFHIKTHLFIVIKSMYKTTKYILAINQKEIETLSLKQVLHKIYLLLSESFNIDNALVYVIYEDTRTIIFNISYNDRLKLTNSDNIINVTDIYPYFVIFENYINLKNSIPNKINQNIKHPTINKQHTIMKNTKNNLENNFINKPINDKNDLENNFIDKPIIDKNNLENNFINKPFVEKVTHESTTSFTKIEPNIISKKHKSFYLRDNPNKQDFVIETPQSTFSESCNLEKPIFANIDFSLKKLDQEVLSKDKFISNKKSYFLIKQDISDGILHENNINPIFILDYGLFNTMLSINKLNESDYNIDKEYEKYVELYNECKDLNLPDIRDLSDSNFESEYFDSKNIDTSTTFLL